QGDGWEQLKKGAGQHIGTADPGQVGNLVLSAHDDIFGEIFRRLDELQPGDELQIYTASQIFTYVVTGTRIVAPTEVSILAAKDYPSATLISCYPYLVDNKRIAVFADLKTQ
ncbi:MAG: class D sortase, partial [Anaerolineales bacterium]